MSADLFIACFGSCAILQVHGLEDGVFSKFFLNCQYCLLLTTLPRLLGGALFGRQLVSEQVQLFRLGKYINITQKSIVCAATSR